MFMILEAEITLNVLLRTKETFVCRSTFLSFFLFPATTSVYRILVHTLIFVFRMCVCLKEDESYNTADFLWRLPIPSELASNRSRSREVVMIKLIQFAIDILCVYAKKSRTKYGS